MISKVFFSIAVIVITFNFCFSQAITDDPSFSYTSALNQDYWITSAIKKDNKSQIILLGGSNGIAKIDSLGKKINSFYQGTFQYDVYNSMKGLLETSDSKIIAFGCFPGYQGHSSGSMVRVLPNGMVDPSFVSPISGNSSHVKAVAELPGGKYICSMGGASSTTLITRLNNGGSFDPGFVSPFSGSLQNVAEFIVQADSSILVVFENFIQKINYDGTIDNSFNSSTVGPQGSSGYSDSEVLDDGKILFLSNNKVYRLLANGVVDNTFTPIVIPTSEFIAKRIVRTNDNKIYVYGRRDYLATASSVLVKRFHLNGTIDNTFNLGQGFNHEYNSEEANALLSFDDGTLSISGSFNGLNNVSAASIVMLTNSGSPLWMHKIGTGLLNHRAYTMHVDASNHIFVGGDFDTYNGLSRNKIAKLDRSGHTDYSFNPGTGFNADVRDILTQTDGKIIVCGQFTSYNGTSVQNIVRLNPNGTIDNSFSAGTGFSGFQVYALGIQSDGKIIVAGDFGTYNNISVARIIRLLPDGSLDPTFTPSSGPNNAVLDLIVKPNDEILICGKFGTYAGTLRARIALLNSNGVLDNSFVPAGAYAHYDTRAMAIQPDGKIVVGGDLGSFTDNQDRRVGRLNPNGSTDSTFVSNAFMYNFPESIGILQNGRIVIGSGTVAIVESNGSQVAYQNLDLTMAGASVNDIYVNPSGNPILVGRFVLAPSKFGISRLKLAPAIQQTEQVFSCGPFTWINGITYTTSTNTPQYTFTNEDGVDSIVSLNLTIGSSSTTDIQIACDSLIWIDGITYTSTTTAPTFTLQSAAGCDSIITLNLTIALPSSGSEMQTACASFTWPINGQTYTSSGQYIDTIPNAAGCDSIITLDLTIIQSSQPLTIENSFSMPSDANSCTGEAAITLSGNADFELDFDNGSQLITSSGYSLVTNLCPGVHDLHVTDNCGDTLSTTIVIPVDSNYVFNNPFIDSLAQDSLGVTLTNCDIYYAGIDTAYIDSIWATGNTVNVIWNIVDSNGSNFDTTSYVLNNGNGVYWLQLSVFCPFKSVGEYFTVTEAIYFNNGSVSTAGLFDIGKDLFEIYPNPTNDQVHISFSGSEAELTVYDVQGKVVLKDRIQNNGIVSLENFERGVYLFDFKNSNAHSVQRVVKQ